MRKIVEFKISGMNLIGLMISSALGAFILAVIVKVSFTISNNFQIIKATSELESSARMLNNFFGKVLLSNGYNNPPTNPNFFKISADGNSVNFSLWYKGGLDGTLLCSGHQETNPANLNLITIFFKKPTSTALSLLDGYATCSDPSLNPSLTLPTNGAASGVSYIPIISKAQFAGFYVAPIVADPGAGVDRIATLPLISANFTATGYKSNGIKLAILLRSSIPVFNIDRTVVYNIFNSGFTFTNVNAAKPNGDKFLYKLVIIQSPFVYTNAYDPTTLSYDLTNSTIVKISN